MGGVVRRRPVQRPEFRLFLLHHAGGSHTLFRGWARRFPAGWDVCAVNAPGRGATAGEPGPTSIEGLVEHVLAEVDGWDDCPFAYFGHSMGALLGFALTLRGASTGRPLPRWLGVSAHPGPRVAEAAPERHLHRYAGDDLRTALGHLDGRPVPDGAAWSAMEPLVRSDLLVAETWRPPPGPLVVPVPVSAFCGDADPVTDRVTAAGWAAHTDRFLGVHEFPGGHFYFRPDPGPLVARIAREIVSAAPGAATGRPGPR